MAYQCKPYHHQRILRRTRLKISRAKLEPCSTQYIYTPLREVDEIRLLHIEPGPWDSDPQCTISHHRLSQQPRFDALSYVWGSEEKPCKIGCGESRTLAVTSNCFDAIKRLRKLGSLTVWIDAVCIDQENDLERGHQVNNMPGIYKAAAKVLVYLGEAEDDADEAVEILRFYKWNLPSNLVQLKPLRKLLQRSWFERIWVLQEVNMAQTVAVICGDHVIPWDPYFRLLAKWGPGNVIEGEIPYVLRLRGQDHNNSQSWDLIDLLDNTRSYKCTDPRDRVFALLSMSSEYSRRGIEPDYTVTVEDVYTQVAAHSLIRVGLDILTMVDHGNRGPFHHLPSWVPDWRRRPSCTPLVKAIGSCSTYSLKDEKYFVTKSSTLLVLGQPFGTLHDLGQPFEPDDSGWDEACIEDWWGLLCGQYQDADFMGLSQILQMSTTNDSVLFTRLRTVLRSVTRSIVQLVLRIVEGEGGSRSTGKIESQPGRAELLLVDASLDPLGNPQVTTDLMRMVPNLLGQDWKRFWQIFDKLSKAKFERVSYSEIMCDLKNVLFADINEWKIYTTSPEKWNKKELGFEEYLLRESPESRDFGGQPIFREMLGPSQKEPGEQQEWRHKGLHGKHEAIISLVRLIFRHRLREIEPPDNIKEYIKSPWNSLLPARLSKSKTSPSAILKKIIGDSWDDVGQDKHLPEPDFQTRFKESDLINLQRVHECCTGRRLFVNEDFAGLVPASAQRGDMFCFLSGGSFPVLLRKVDGHEILVGACYVVGDMKSQVQRQRWFTIK